MTRTPRASDGRYGGRSESGGEHVQPAQSRGRIDDGEERIRRRCRPAHAAAFIEIAGKQSDADALEFRRVAWRGDPSDRYPAVGRDRVDARTVIAVDAVGNEYAERGAGQRTTSHRSFSPG